MLGLSHLDMPKLTDDMVVSKSPRNATFSPNSEGEWAMVKSSYINTILYAEAYKKRLLKDCYCPYVSCTPRKDSQLGDPRCSQNSSHGRKILSYMDFLGY